MFANDFDFSCKVILDFLDSLIFFKVFDVGFNKCKGVRHLADLSHFSVVSIELTVENVISNRSVKQNGLLLNEANLLAQTANVVVLNGLSVD